MTKSRIIIILFIICVCKTFGQTIDYRYEAKAITRFSKNPFKDDSTTADLSPLLMGIGLEYNFIDSSKLFSFESGLLAKGGYLFDIPQFGLIPYFKLLNRLITNLINLN